MPSSSSSSIHSPTIGLRGHCRSAYGRAIPAAPTLDSAVSSPPKRHTWSPSNRLSEWLSQKSGFQFDTPDRSKTDTQYTKPNFSSGFDRATGVTHEGDTITASALHSSPPPSLYSNPTSHTDRSSDTSSQHSSSSTHSESLELTEGSGGFLHFRDFDELKAEYDKEEENKRNNKSTETSTSPSRSSCEQTSIGDIRAPKDDPNWPSQPDTPTQAETSNSTLPSGPRTAARAQQTCVSSTPLPVSRTRRLRTERKLGMGIQAC